MGKLDDIQKPPPAKCGSDCRWSMLDEMVDADDRAKIAAWLGDRSVGNGWIARTLTDAFGVEIGIHSVARHRHRDCRSCEHAGRTWHG